MKLEPLGFDADGGLEFVCAHTGLEFTDHALAPVCAPGPMSTLHVTPTLRHLLPPEELGQAFADAIGRKVVYWTKCGDPRKDPTFEPRRFVPADVSDRVLRDLMAQYVALNRLLWQRALDGSACSRGQIPPTWALRHSRAGARGLQHRCFPSLRRICEAGMKSQFDLFTYPHSAGFKELTTSRDNAIRIEENKRAPTLRERVRIFFLTGGTATADELAVILEENFRSVQPRVAELRALKFIEPTGERRRGSGGGEAHVWRKAP